MANVATGFGLVPYRALNAEAASLRATALDSYNTALGIGDPIKLSSGNAQVCGANDSTEGVIIGIENLTLPTSAGDLELGQKVDLGAASTLRLIEYLKAEDWEFAIRVIDATVTAGTTYKYDVQTPSTNGSRFRLDQSESHATANVLTAIAAPADAPFDIGLQLPNAAGTGEIAIVKITASKVA